jgi:hypothetical protein
VGSKFLVDIPCFSRNRMFISVRTLKALNLPGTVEKPQFHEMLLSDTRQEYKYDTQKQSFHTWYFQASTDGGEKRSDDERMSGRPRVDHVLYTGLAS